MSTDEYVPSEDLIIKAWKRYSGAQDARYARLSDGDAGDEARRFLARVRRDAAREALDGLANAYADDPDINEPEYEREAFVILAARHYRNTHYPEGADSD